MQIYINSLTSFKLDQCETQVVNYVIFILHIFIFVYNFFVAEGDIACETHDHTCHIWRPKLRGQLLKRTQQNKRGQRVVWCVTWICVQVFQLFFFLSMKSWKYDLEKLLMHTIFLFKVLTYMANVIIVFMLTQIND